jgi:hypothetical protein
MSLVIKNIIKKRLKTKDALCVRYASSVKEKVVVVVVVGGGGGVVVVFETTA